MKNPKIAISKSYIGYSTPASQVLKKNSYQNSIKLVQKSTYMKLNIFEVINCLKLRKAKLIQIKNTTLKL